MPLTNQPNPDYPARTVRTCRIANLCPDRECTLAGRLTRKDDEAFLSDETGTIRVEVSDSIVTGSIIEAAGRWRIHTFAATTSKVLVPAVANGDRQNRKRIHQLRADVLREIRTFFNARDFTEVETPLLIRSPGMEPHLRAFETDTESGRHLYLPTSPEYAMKRLLSEGLERIYQICKSFRDEAPAGFHNPEFTMLEWYRAFADYRDIAVDTESLIAHVASRVTGSTRLQFGAIDVDLATPWERITVREAFRRYSDIDGDPCGDPLDFLSTARKSVTTSIARDDDFSSAFFRIFLDQIEPNLGSPRPTILTDYPESMAALAKRSPDFPGIAERFEVYITGIELANAFTELNDPTEQRDRLEREAAERASLDVPRYPIDESFLGALQTGMPPSGGIALGVDRLIMLLAGASHIENVLAFPFPDM